jgi:hypothetical protein
MTLFFCILGFILFELIFLDVDDDGSLVSLLLAFGAEASLYNDIFRVGLFILFGLLLLISQTCLFRNFIWALF